MPIIFVTAFPTRLWWISARPNSAPKTRRNWTNKKAQTKLDTSKNPIFDG
jgi:hypothetical protein